MHRNLMSDPSTKPHPSYPPLRHADHAKSLTLKCILPWQFELDDRYLWNILEKLKDERVEWNIVKRAAWMGQSMCNWSGAYRIPAE